MKPSSGGSSLRSDEVIDERIVEACQALWWAELVRAGLRLVIGGIATLLAWVVFDQWIYSPGTLPRVALFVGLLGGLGWYLYRHLLPLMRSSIRPEYAARSLERDLPELRQALTSYVTLRDDRETPGLRSRVVRSIGAATAGRLRSYDQLPAEATGTLRWWVATAAALSLLVAYSVLSPKNSLQTAARLVAPIASINPAARVAIKDVRPGNVDAIAGRTIEVSALIDGLRENEQAVCRWELSSGPRDETLQLGSEGRRYTAQLRLPHSASGDVAYRIIAGDAVAGPFQLYVQDVPVVALQGIHYQPPSYTRQSPHTSSSGAITGLDGTRVTVRAATNRPIAKATIEFNPRPIGQTVRATAGATEMKIDQAGTALEVTFPLRSARGRSAAVELESYRIQVWDAADQSNPEPIIYPIRVITDLPPEVAITTPLTSPQDVQITNEVQVIEVHASDPDFGLKSIVLELRAGIDMIDQPVIWSDAAGAKGNQVAEYRFVPRQHGLRIGDTVQVVAVATDNRASDTDPRVEGNVTRTDPIQLRIVPDDGGPTKSPEDRSPEDPQGKSKSSEQEAGSKGSGDQGQEQSGGGGGSGAGQQQAGDGQSGQGQAGEGQAGDSKGQAEPGSEQGSGSDSSQGVNDQPSDNAAGNGSSGGESSMENPPGDPDQPPSGGSDPSAGNAKGEGGQPDAAGQPGSMPGETAGDAPQPTPGGTDGAQPQPNPNGPPATSDPSQGAGSQAPQHDGEAFERIRNYLEQKQKNQNPSPDGSAADQQPSDPVTDPQAANGAGSGDPSARPERAGTPPKTEPRDPSPRSENAGDPSAEKQNESQSATPQPGGSADADQHGQEKSAADEAAAGKSAANGAAEPNQARGDQQSPTDSGQQSDSGTEARQQDPAAAKPAGDPQNEQGMSDSGEPAKPESGQPGEPQDGQPGESPQSQSETSPNAQQADESESSAGSKPAAQQDPQGDQGTDEAAADGPKGNSKPSPSQSGSEAKSHSPKGGSDSAQTDASSQNQSDNAAQSQPSDAQGSPSGQPPSQAAPSPQDSSSTQGNPGAGDGAQGDGAESPVPPEPVNLDYAKNATDMVLDYLEQTRDQPDRQLLDQLNWSEEDLKRFRDRWQNVRELDKPGATDPNRLRDFEETLKSLGLRAPAQPTGNVRESADQLRSIRDAGNRKPPPAAHRDAFDAFRRAMGQK